MFLGSRSGNITRENITWQSTLVGALSLVVVQVALRLSALALVIAWVLLTGRGAGIVLIAWSACIALRVRVRTLFPLRLSISRRRRMKRHTATKATVLLAVGLVLILFWATGYWPGIVWDIGGGRLWLALPTISRGFGPLWLWIRLALIAFGPWTVMRPGFNLDWVLDIETRWPKAREVGFGQADIESPAVRGPRGRGEVRRAARGGASDDLLAALAEFGLQNPNPPDEGSVMRVDGV